MSPTVGRGGRGQDLMPYRGHGRGCDDRVTAGGHERHFWRRASWFALCRPAPLRRCHAPDRPAWFELAANWRAQPPVQMDIGPVLHIDDVVAGKMSALYTRAEPRDFLDIDAALATGRYTWDRLCELAEQVDSGFDRRVLAELFGVLERYPDRRFAAYGTDQADIEAMRERFARWRQRLIADL